MGSVEMVLTCPRVREGVGSLDVASEIDVGEFERRVGAVLHGIGQIAGVVVQRCPARRFCAPATT